MIRTRACDLDQLGSEHVERSLLPASRFQSDSRVRVEKDVVSAVARGSQVDTSVAVASEGLFRKELSSEKAGEAGRLFRRHRLSEHRVGRPGPDRAEATQEALLDDVVAVSEELRSHPLSPRLYAEQVSLLRPGIAA